MSALKASLDAVRAGGGEVAATARRSGASRPPRRPRRTKRQPRNRPPRSPERREPQPSGSAPARAKGSAKAKAKDTARLSSYRAKRDFARTPEPAGGARAGRRRARASSIQEHDATRLHWDLRLEHDGVLVSWAIPKGLPEAPKENHFAAATEDHPLEYLDFEGEIPKGQYGAGTMTIWDRGTYECLKWEPRKVEVALHGERVDARYALFPIAQGEQPKDWMIHRMDPPADPEREPMPARIEPMLATRGAAAARRRALGV